MTGLRAEPTGVLVVDKPEGPTSHDVVAVTRRLLRTRQVGHTGTLDPMATGVLVLCLGRATRLARFLTGQDKTYRGTLRLGLETDTLDRTGRPAGPHFPEDRISDPARRLCCPSTLRLSQVCRRSIPRFDPHRWKRYWVNQ